MTHEVPILFVLTPSEGLGRAVAEDYGLEVAPHELLRSEDGEQAFRPLCTVRGRDVYVLGSLHDDGGESAGERLCRLLFFVATLRDEGAARVTVVAPYLGYTRHDRRSQARAPIATRYLARQLEVAGAARIVTVDPHDRAAYENAFRIPAEHLDAGALFADHCLGLAAGRLTIVCPEPHGLPRVEALRDALTHADREAVELAVYGAPRAGELGPGPLAGNIAGRTAVIVDDRVTTGVTLARCALACREHGATAVHALATHGLFTASAGPTLASLLDSVAVTDTIAPGRTALGLLDGKRTILSVAPLLARAISALHHERSMTGS